MSDIFEKSGYKKIDIPANQINIWLRTGKDSIAKEQNKNFIKNTMLDIESVKVTLYIKLFNLLHEHTEISKKEFLELIDDNSFKKELSKIPFTKKEETDILNELADIQGPIYSNDESEFIASLIKDNLIVGFDEKNSESLQEIKGYQSEEEAIEGFTLIAEEFNWSDDDVKTLAKRIFENRK